MSSEPNDRGSLEVTGTMGDRMLLHCLSCKVDYLWKADSLHLCAGSSESGQPMTRAELEAAGKKLWQGESPVAIAAECDAVKSVLLLKNVQYGNSALDPLRVFSRADPIEQINVRLDDTLSRIARGSNETEDTELDLIGYLILKRVAKRMGVGNAGR